MQALESQASTWAISAWGRRSSMVGTRLHMCWMDGSVKAAEKQPI
jgi:hypothetical protein